MHALLAVQVRAFLDVAAGDRFVALYCLADGTGMRQSELLGLTWSDVDLDREALAVRQQLSRVRGVGFTFSEPKTEKGHWRAF
jgi:integrase